MGRNTRRLGDAAVRIRRIVTLDDIEYLAPILNAVGEDRHAIQCRAVRDKSTRRYQADCRLDADDTVESGGDPARTAGIGSERKHDMPRSHDDGGAGTRSARNIRDVSNAAARAIGRACSGEAGCELIEIGFSETDRAGGRQALDADSQIASGIWLNEAQAAVVGIPATSMLSLTPKGTPRSGKCSPLRACSINALQAAMASCFGRT